MVCTHDVCWYEYTSPPLSVWNLVHACMQKYLLCTNSHVNFCLMALIINHLGNQIQISDWNQSLQQHKDCRFHLYNSHTFPRNNILKQDRIAAYFSSFSNDKASANKGNRTVNVKELIPQLLILLKIYEIVKIKFSVERKTRL